jgi:hypothetical protein
VGKTLRQAQRPEWRLRSLRLSKRLGVGIGELPLMFMIVQQIEPTITQG